MKQQVWPCGYCVVAERDLPSDFGKDTNAYKRIIAHERNHVAQTKSQDPRTPRH